MATLRFFNPGCELEVVNGKPNYNLQKNPRLLETDLQNIPMFLADDGDFVVAQSQNLPQLREFSDKLRQLVPGLPECEFVSAQATKKCRKVFDSFAPWGISPRVMSIARNFIFSDDFNLNCPISEFRPEHKLLFSRETSVKFLGDFLSVFADDSIFPSLSQRSIIVRDLDTAIDFFRKNMDSENHGCVFKAPFGASGRGVRIFRNNSLSDNIFNWTDFVIKNQGCVECEHLFDRVSDFSMHYTIKDGKAEFFGVSVFNTAENGFYKSSLVKNFSEIPGFSRLSAERLSEMHRQILENSAYAKNYSGPLGIDCMVYREDGELKLNPCIEINCRNSMGRLAMRLAEFVCQDTRAEYFVYQNSQQDSRFLQPPVFESGKLKSGFLRLTPENTQNFSAGILASE